MSSTPLPNHMPCKMTQSALKHTEQRTGQRMHSATTAHHYGICNPRTLVMSVLLPVMKQAADIPTCWHLPQHMSQHQPQLCLLMLCWHAKCYNPIAAQQLLHCPGHLNESIAIDQAGMQGTPLGDGTAGCNLQSLSTAAGHYHWPWDCQLLLQQYHHLNTCPETDHCGGCQPYHWACGMIDQLLAGISNQGGSIAS